MQQCDARTKYLEQPKSYPGYREKYPHHGVVADTDHPVFNTTRMRYIKACCTFNGDQRDHTSQSNFLGKAWDIYDQSSKLNPTKAFGLTNCLRICKENGADSRYLQELQYKDGRSTASYPEGITTFTYPPEKTFWVHTEKIGLMELMFPSDAPHSDFYQAILNG